jgi:hypothetical protein
MKNCKEIIEKHLKDNGFDGLVHLDTECGCHMGDDGLALCDHVDTSELMAALKQVDATTFSAHWPDPKELFEVQNVPGGFRLVPSERLRQYVQPLEYHPHLDGPAEPVGLAMAEEEKCACDPAYGIKCAHHDDEEDRVNRMAARELLNCGSYR